MPALRRTLAARAEPPSRACYVDMPRPLGASGHRPVPNEPLVPVELEDLASFSISDRGRRRPAPSRHTEASGWTLRRWRQQASGETWDVFRMSSDKFFDEIVEFAACGLTDR